MKRKIGYLAFVVLCLLLVGCGPKTAQVTPTPSPSAMPEATVTPTPPTATPEPTATPAPWEEDPRGYIMGWLDKLLDGEKIYLHFWIHPGSGPTPTVWSAAEYAQTVRTLFEELDWDDAKLLTWEEQDAEDEDLVNAPGAYGVTLNDEDWWGEGYFSFSLNSRVIRVNWGDDQLYFLVPGSEEMCTKLTDLEPSVYVNLGRVRVPAQESQKATLKLYLETALERTKELGHIADYELRDYAVVTWSADGERLEEEENAEAEEEEHPNICYTATYAVKPTHPGSEFWKYCTFDEDGWFVADVNVEEYMDFLVYDERDGCYGML